MSTVKKLKKEQDSFNDALIDAIEDLYEEIATLRKDLDLNRKSDTARDQEYNTNLKKMKKEN